MRSDFQIQQDVIEQLNWDPILNAAEIGVAVTNGIVTLTGIVNTYSKKIAAENAAKTVSGVKAVAEDIQVGSSHDFRKTDTEIALAILNALKWDTSVPDERIKFKVEDGFVTMEGEVEWDYQRRAAETAIKNLEGVRNISNRIAVKQGVMPNNIKQRITAALHRSATVDANNISVEVIGRDVTLSGKVRSIAEEDDAVAAAWLAPGVNNVESQLEIEEEELVF